MSDKVRLPQLNFETVGSIAAIVIGACALFVAWDQAQVMRKQQHASVWPILSVDFSVDEDEAGLFVELNVANVGVGPAVIESAALLIDGEPVTRWVDFEERLFRGDDPTGTINFNSSDFETSVLGPGEQETALRASWGKTDANISAFRTLALSYVSGEGADVRLDICYCSVFDRCFQSTAGKRPEPVSRCPAPTGFIKSFFAQDQEADG